jgi:hypothetical protein
MIFIRTGLNSHTGLIFSQPVLICSHTGLISSQTCQCSQISMVF